MVKGGFKRFGQTPPTPSTHPINRICMRPSETSKGCHVLSHSNQSVGRRSLSLFVLVGVLLLEVGWDGLHDLLSLALIVNRVSVEVLGSAQLQLGHTSLSILLDCDLIRLGKVRLLPSHHLDELFQILDFLGLKRNNKAKD